MTPLSSLLGTRSTRAAVVLVAVLHAVVLFGFAQYQRTGSALNTPFTAANNVQFMEVVFAAATPAATDATDATEAIAPLTRIRPITPALPTQVPLPLPKTTETLQQVQLAEPGVAEIAVQDSSRPMPLPTTSHSEDARADAQPLQAAKPDYAYNPQPDYPVLLREQGVGGVVWLRVWVDSEGHPGEIKLAKGSGYRLLDDAALRAVRQWRFVPAKKGEQKLASWVEFPIRFTLNG